MLAGVGRVDITPPPGFPTGGHGPAGAVSRGHWARLHATAFFFQDHEGRALVLVSCDLFAIPGRIHRDVAEAVKLREHSRRMSLPMQAIVIAATHTHQGPGNFMSAAIYNRFGSVRGGYSVTLRAHLVDRIAEAIDLAVKDALDHRDFDLIVHTGRMKQSLLRNRSPETFMLNGDRDLIMNTFNPHGQTRGLDSVASAKACVAARRQGEPESSWDIEGCPRLRAVDRGLTVLELRRNGTPAALAVFLAMHPTVLLTDTPFYSPDVFGIASAINERQLGTKGAVPKVAFFNGAEGDITARRTTRDLRDVVLLADTLARAVRDIRLHGTHTTIERSARIESRLHFATWGDSIGAHALARRPMGGAAGFGGAEDDRTILYALGWRERIRAPVPDPEHGIMQPALDSPLLPGLKLTRFIVGKWRFPYALPFSFSRIGSFALAAVPLEPSTAQGFLIRRELGDAPHGRLEIITLANEYASYAATADEYAAQDYMGASTIGGPEEGAFVSALLHRLADSTGFRAGGARPIYRPGPHKHFGPDELGTGRTAADEGLELVLRDSLRLPHRHLPFFQWEEEHESLTSAIKNTGRRRVEVVRLDGTVLDDDHTTYGLLTLLNEAPRKSARLTAIWVGPRWKSALWTAIWVRPLWDRKPGAFRFRVTKANGDTICSQAFEIDSRKGVREAVPRAKGGCPGVQVSLGTR
jgi:neutral ceramidase